MEGGRHQPCRRLVPRNRIRHGYHHSHGNQYGVILVNPVRHPHVKQADGQTFIDWLTGPTGQKAIAGFKVENQQLFFPNARESGV